MQFSNTLALAVLLLTTLLTSRATGQADDQAKANRNSLLLRRGNVGRPLGRTTATTTTTTTASPADYAEDEYAESYDEGRGEDGPDEEDGPAGGKPPTTTTTTTEPPKKIRPSIRPFRSNDDLLTALKKRRQESKNSKPAPAPKEKVYDDEDVPAPAAPAKSAKAPAIVPSKRRFGSGAARKDDHAADTATDGQNGDGPGSDGGNGAKSLIGRLGRSRFALKQ